MRWADLRFLQFKMRKVKLTTVSGKNPDFPILKSPYLMILASPEEQAEKLSTGDGIAGTM